MDFSFSNSSWQAQNLPEGFSLNGGVISGSHSIKGSYSVPVTVNTDFGADTKNITINVRSRPGTENFPILQNGIEIEQVTIPQLVASIRDGTAQQKYNCTNTQIVIPVIVPHIFWGTWNHGLTIYYEYNYTTQNVNVNFCDFQNVTLLDGSVKLGLILQFDKAIWTCYTSFDTPDNEDKYYHNRWKFSNLRQWLNSSGKNWFSPAYTGDTLFDDFSFGECAYFAQQETSGFLSLLPDDLQEALLPTRIVTAVYWDDDNYNIPDPELIDNIDCDVSFDKVFIPSLSQMAFYENFEETSFGGSYEVASIEGEAWAFYSFLRENHTMGDHLNTLLEDEIIEQHAISSHTGRLSRSPCLDDNTHIFYVSEGDENTGRIGVTTTCSELFASPAPAFVLC